LTGKLCVLAGKDEFRSEAGPWSVLGADALLLPDGTYTPDFTAYVSSDHIKCIRISKGLIEDVVYRDIYSDFGYSDAETKGGGGGEGGNLNVEIVAKRRQERRRQRRERRRKKGRSGNPTDESDGNMSLEEEEEEEERKDGDVEEGGQRPSIEEKKETVIINPSEIELERMETPHVIEPMNNSYLGGDEGGDTSLVVSSPTEREEVL